MNTLDYISSNIEKKMSYETEKIILIVYGFALGYTFGSMYGFSSYLKMNKFVNMYTNIKKFTYNLQTKTFYIDGDINGDLVDEFKSFMRNVKHDETVDIVIDTYGGCFSSAQMMTDIILTHKGITNAIVLNKAFSAGSLIALSCANLYMHKNAHLSPVDVLQGDMFSTVQLSAVQTIINNKSKDKIGDNTFILADQAEKCKKLLDVLFSKIISPKYQEAEANKIKQEFFDGTKNVHSTTFSRNDLTSFGIVVYDITPTMFNKASCKIIKDKNNFYFNF